MIPIKVVVVIGPPCVGKMTVGQEICKRTGFNLMTNHTAIEPVIATLGKLHWPTIQKIKDTLYEALRYSGASGVVITCAIEYDDPTDWTYLEHIESMFPNAEFSILELRASLETRLERASTENRLEYKPSQRDVDAVRERILLSVKRCPDMELKYIEFVKFVKTLRGTHFMSIVNDVISASDVAETAIKQLGLFD